MGGPHKKKKKKVEATPNALSQPTTVTKLARPLHTTQPLLLYKRGLRETTNVMST